MKSSRLGPAPRLSKLCRWLFLAVAVKLGILTALFLDAPFSQISLFMTEEAPKPAAIIAVIEADIPAAPALEPEAAPATAATTIAEALPAAEPAPRTARPGEALAAEPAMPVQQPQAAAAPITSESLLRRQEELNQREQDLLALERQIDLKLNELQNIEKRIQSMLAEADATRDEKLKHLVDVYTNMKARQAAEVLETLDERIAVKILANMRGRQAGEILSFVKPEKAARLSEALTRIQMPLDY